jgi:hypothetical protein
MKNFHDDLHEEQRAVCFPFNCARKSLAREHQNNTKV